MESLFEKDMIVQRPHGKASKVFQKIVRADQGEVCLHDEKIDRMAFRKRSTQ